MRPRFDKNGLILAGTIRVVKRYYRTTKKSGPLRAYPVETSLSPLASVALKIVKEAGEALACSIR